MPASVRRVVGAVVAALSIMLLAVAAWFATAHHDLVGPPASQAKGPSASLSAEQANKILASTFTTASLGETKTGAAAGEQLRTAYTNEGLRAAGGRVKLARLHPVVATSPLLAPHPRLLAVSRGVGFPRFIVAQTVASDRGLPILHLLTCPDAATPYRISMSVEMVAPATVRPFEPLSKGSPLVTGGAGLAVAPVTLLSQYAAQMAFPAKAIANPPFAPDPFSAQLRVGAAGVAKAVASQARFSQVHKVAPSSVYAVGQAGGDALVFGVLERTDTFAVKAGQRVNTVANKAFVLLTGKRQITKAASMTTLEFVVFAVPRTTGPATLVAAREQIVAGSGS